MAGLKDATKYIETLWNSLHNTALISHCSCRKRDIEKHTIDGKHVVSVYVPLADRRRRPVHVGADVFKWTFKRRNSSDYHCDDAEVRQMIRDASSDPQDRTIQSNTSIDDIDGPTLQAFRNKFASRAPDHPNLLLNDLGLLLKIGAWREDRTQKEEGLTLAGMLMFGTEDALAEFVPDMHMTFLEQSMADPAVRYDDRIASDDGDWVPNLFNFYHKVYPRLVEGLRNPFKLNPSAMREGETQYHEAVREALMNALVHTDFRSRGAIRIIKRPDGYTFQNPGRSLTPIDRIIDARHKGEELTDIRNKSLVLMFSRLGLCEREGTGYPKIFRAWDDGKRQSPLISEDLERNIVQVNLPLVSQLSPEIEAELSSIIGDQWAMLDGVDKDILVHAHQFGETSNQMIQFIHRLHARDIGKRLKRLSDEGWLVPQGERRGRTYRFAGSGRDDLFKSRNSTHTDGESSRNGGDSSHTDGESSHSEVFKGSLEEIAKPIASTGRVSPEKMQAVIVRLCTGRFLTADELATLCNRNVAGLRSRTLAHLVERSVLAYKYPDEPNHPEQAYTAINQ